MTIRTRRTLKRTWPDWPRRTAGLLELQLGYRRHVCRFDTQRPAGRPTEALGRRQVSTEMAS
jgi:hypothetical protein